MIYNYLIIALRNVFKNPLYSFINILSLAIGIAACMVIYLFVQDESGFDSFHSKKDNIYRLDEIQTFSGTKPQKVALSMPGMGPAMLSDFPEVESYTRFYTRGKRLYTKDGNRFLIERTVAVDSTFLDFFDFELLAGDRSIALDEPNSVLLTEETALKFFNSVDDAIGNTIATGEDTYKITGILKNIGENSHLQYDILLSMATIMGENPDFNHSWGSNYVNTYLILSQRVDIASLEGKFDDFMVRHMESDDITEYYKLFLQPLDQVHLASMDIEHDYNNYRKFNGKYLDVFTTVGFFILIIACVNFMNLTMARASHRWKEIGVRKSIGAQKGQLLIQFVMESVLLAFFALLLACFLNLLLLPLLNDLINRQLSLLSLLATPVSVVIAIGISLLLGVVAGLYPALYMAAFKAVHILKGGQQSGSKSVFRSSLIIVQFGLAMAMIVSTLVVVQQLHFMRDKDIGFDKEHMLLIDMNREANDKFEVVKNELLGSAHVQGVTASGQRMGNNFHQWGFKVKTDTGLFNMTPSNVFVDYDYLNVYGIKVKEGRGFSKEYSTDDGMAFVINQSLADELGLDEPIGTTAGHSWYPDDSLGSIVGVTENFNFNSLHHKVNTLSMVVHPDWGYDEMSVKIANGNEDMQQVIAEIKSVWDRHVKDWPFEYTFLDQHVDNLYRSDQQMSSVVSIMAGLAILIACMGLFGLAAITTKKKVKEIGIRKVLGASIGHIIYVLSKNFLSLILIAFILISPITYYLLEEWLANFAFRIDVSVLLFVIGGLISLAIAMVTMGYHVIRAARGNPANALRVE